ncbi:3-phenylpropionate/trans-cinnamate dioxygenase ferredoxin component [Methylomarinovum caldicuralii]|uniref:3-phenylpropionate/trans-cinnamate dioxygenase ferredoxin component n=1 Tax=Methylomarinovum caldicuralii TaxID=438856 RepID=A0AAU9C389_9GAMM|nr:non-heme iron oxygenase ferredoxin subunit [Methylomarinovum caldicuralii]BCX81609.1 3-phenylpropionate/trans-cinnamate dioxygenase ferredoxin component [Methylomarinovum caldicuralii]
MSDWIEVCKVEDLKPGQHVVVEVDGTEVAVFNLDGGFYAIEDVCTHDGAEIASGEVEGDVIVCPRHGARFCIKTGEVLSPPAYEDLHVFPVRVKDGMVQVRDDR